MKSTAPSTPAGPSDLPVSQLVALPARMGGDPVRALFEPDAVARGRIAGFLGVDALDALRLDVRLIAEGAEGWRAEGRIRARYAQTCVVTLARLEQSLDEAVERRFLPAAEIPIPEEREHGPDEPDEPDAIRDDGTVDVAALAIEVLALAVDPYPRAEDAAFGQKVFAAPGVTPLTDEAMRPFAKLEALKAKLAEGGDGTDDR